MCMNTMQVLHVRYIKNAENAEHINRYLKILREAIDRYMCIGLFVRRISFKQTLF